MNDRTKPTSPANQSASRSIDVDRLFARLAARYGRHWLDMWVGVPLDLVKAEWRETLARFHPVQVEQAIAALGKFPPTLPEFAAICDDFKRPEGAPNLRIAGPRSEVPAGTFKRLRDILGQ